MRNNIYRNITDSTHTTTEKTEMMGLGIGVVSMKNGERMQLHVGWEVGY